MGLMDGGQKVAVNQPKPAIAGSGGLPVSPQAVAQKIRLEQQAKLNPGAALNPKAVSFPNPALRQEKKIRLIKLFNNNYNKKWNKESKTILEVLIFKVN